MEQAYTNELELEVAQLLEENAKLKKQLEEVTLPNNNNNYILLHLSGSIATLSLFKYGSIHSIIHFCINYYLFMRRFVLLWTATFGNGCSAAKRNHPQKKLISPILRKNEKKGGSIPLQRGRESPQHFSHPILQPIWTPIPKHRERERVELD